MQHQLVLRCAQWGCSVICGTSPSQMLPLEQKGGTVLETWIGQSCTVYCAEIGRMLTLSTLCHTYDLDITTVFPCTPVSIIIKFLVEFALSIFKI